MKQGKDEIPNCKPNLVEIFFRRKRFLPKPSRKQKPNHEIFGVFQNLEKIFSQNIFSRKKKFFEMKYILRISSQILENPKNFMISFFHPLSFNGVVLGENLSSLLFKGLSGKKCFNNFHFLRK